MKITPWLIVALWLQPIFTTHAASGDEFRGSWHRFDGAVIDGTLVDVYGGLALIHGKTANVFIGLESMTDEELDRVDHFLVTQSAGNTRWKESKSKVWWDLRDKLKSVQNGKVRFYDPAERAEPELYLAYFSASWCPPCHRFTPLLVEAYQRIQQRWPGRVEVVLISSDETASAAEKYMIDAHMPWLMLRFGTEARALTQWAAAGIPCLVAVSRSGDVLFHSYQGKTYIGPESVLEKCEQLLPTLDPKSPGGLRARHRLAVRHYRVQIGDNSSAVKPYLLQVDPARAEFIPEKGLLLVVEVDEAGRVADVSVEGQPYSPICDALKPDMSNWLFLPAIEHGKPVKATVKIPLAKTTHAAGKADDGRREKISREGSEGSEGPKTAL